MIASDADACQFSRCLDFGSCFFYRARREAARAHLLVAIRRAIVELAL